MGLPLDRFKTLVREQYFILLLEPERAMTAFAVLVPNVDDRRKLFSQVDEIVGASGVRAAADAGRLAELSRVLELSPASVARS
jgi:hypothetical protein